MASNQFLDLLIGYEKEGREERKFVTCNVSGKIISARGTVARSRMSRFTSSLSAYVSHTSTRAYGMLLLGFGLLTLLLHFVKDYVNFYTQVPLYVLVSGALFAALAIPLLLVDKPIAYALQENPISDYILFEFFCIQRAGRQQNNKGLNPIVALFVGFLLAGLGAVVPLWCVILGFFLACYIYVAFLSPEFSFLSIFLFLPYFPLIPYHSLVLSGAVVLTAISFLRKVMLGKRVMRLEQYDLIIVVFMLFVLVSGIFVKGIESFESSLVMLALGLGYLFSSSLVSNRRIAECIINALIISGVPVSVISVIRFVSSACVGNFSLSVSATFDSSTELAVFMIVTSLLSVYFIKEETRVGAKIFYSLTLTLSLVSILFSGAVFAFFALLFGALAYAAAGMRRMSWLPIMLLIFSPYLLLVFVALAESLFSLPQLSFIKLSSVPERWRIGMEMFRENIFTGIGIGEECFILELSKYSLESTYYDSGNFLLELGLEAGVFALVAVLLLLAARLVHGAVYSSYARRSHLFSLHRISYALLVALMCFGTVSYLWSDETMCYLFWCIFGLGSAGMRVSRQEHDDRVDYYSDGRTQHSSSVDIEIG